MIYVALICDVAVSVNLLTVYHVPFPWFTFSFYAVILGLLHVRFARIRAERRERDTLNP